MLRLVITLVVVSTSFASAAGEELRWFKLSQPTPRTLQPDLLIPIRVNSFSFMTPETPIPAEQWLSISDLPDAIGSYVIALPWVTANPWRNPLRSDFPWSYERIDKRTIKFNGGSYIKYGYGYTPINVMVIMDTTICDLFCGLEAPPENAFKDGAFGILSPQWPKVDLIYCR